MLHIYSGSGTADRERFIFNNIDPEKKTILIVPDQFSLQAERDAFRYLNRESLTELMIADFSALGHKIVGEVEGREPEIIDKYGRHMLLSVIVDEIADELTAYGSLKERNSFIEHMNTMISELKRYEISADKLETIHDSLTDPEKRADHTYLKMKLEDILKIYRAYESAISETYQDSEDYITYYSDRISGSDLIRGADIWIYGFDTFTPKHLMVIRQLMIHAGSVSVVLTDGTKATRDPVRELTLNEGDGLFDLTETVMKKLERAAEEVNVAHERHIIEIERDSIWKRSEDELSERIDLALTSDHHREVERAAAYIQKLVRDEGYRYGDITVICNDTEGIAAMLSRSLQRMGIPVFADHRRKVLHQPVVSFLLSFLDIINYGYQGDGLMGMIKSGLSGLDSRQEELLENYVREFKIRSGRWQEPFIYKADQYTDEDLEELNRSREYLTGICDRARDSIGRRNTAREKINGLYSFLRDDFGITEKIEELIRRQTDLELYEGASETAQIWNALCGIFDQMIRVIGERKISNKTMSEMIRTGLTAVDIGLVPVSRDCILMGTMQRTRPGQVRALVIVGAEEGVLPLYGREAGLLTKQELEILEAMDLELARKDSIAEQEEQIALYRICSTPVDRLYVSCSMTGKGSAAARPSYVFEKLRKYQRETGTDLEKSDMMESIVHRRMTVSYLAEALRKDKRKGRNSTAWNEVREWYRREEPVTLDAIEQGAAYDNRVENLTGELAEALYTGDEGRLTVSASRLEKFGSCPFAHFIKYGLHPREQRLFEVGGREIGDVYHRCIMEYCEELSVDEGRTDARGWSEITREECFARIRRIMENREEYRGGLLGRDEDSRFRMERITDICGDIAWALTQQIRKSRIKSMRFEEPFGRGRLPGTDIEVGGKKIHIIGTIDRMDVMGIAEDEDGTSVRIIDYKTGNTDIDPDEIKNGYQLQLAMYMDAARQEKYMRPAGIFHFNIKEFIADEESVRNRDPEEIDRQIQKSYRLSGITVSDPEILMQMDDGLDGVDKYESTVVPVKYDPKKEEFLGTGGGTLMSGKEFSELLSESRKQAERICREIYEGKIDPQPHKTGKKDMDGNEYTPCKYCDFGSICRYS